MVNGNISAALAFLTLCLVFAAGGCWHFYRLWKDEEKRRKRQKAVLDAADAKYFCYDAVNDVLNISEAGAAMFGTERTLENYSTLNRNTMAHDERIRLKNLDTLVAEDGDGKELRIFRRDNNTPGIFRVVSLAFTDDAGHDDKIMGLLIDKTAAAVSEEQLASMREMDDLTHIYNSSAVRTLIRDKLATYDGKELAAFVIINVDGFKEINNKMGHQVGDRVLLLIATTLKDILRSNDYVGRLGGDEFCVYFTKIPNADLMPSICERINKQVTNRAKNSNITVDVTVSIGCTIVKLKDDFKAIYGRADQALYRAKEGGRNTYRIEL